MLPLAALVAHVTDTCEAESVEVVSLGIDEASLPEVEEWRWTGATCRTRPTLRLTGWRNNAVVASYTVRLQLKIDVAVPVVADAVVAGQPVKVEMGTASLPLPRTLDPDRAYRARRRLEAGAPLTNLNVEPVPDAPAGASVTLMARRGGLEITAPGELLRDANTGQRVRALNRALGVPVDGVLVAPDLVEIR